jgi:hypothetical protein
MFRRVQNLGNGVTRVEESDGRGGFVVREIYGNQGNHRNHREIEPEFPEMQRGGGFLFGRRSGGGSPFQEFFRLLEMMAGNSGEVEQGLTKDELKKLDKIKFKAASSHIKKEEKELCTICYCEF